MRTVKDLEEMYKKNKQKKEKPVGKKSKCEICERDNLAVASAHGLKSVCSQCRQAQSQIVRFPNRIIYEFERIHPGWFAHGEDVADEKEKLKLKIRTLIAENLQLKDLDREAEGVWRRENKQLLAQVGELTAENTRLAERIEAQPAVNTAPLDKDVDFEKLVWRMVEVFATKPEAHICWEDILLLRSKM